MNQVDFNLAMQSVIKDYLNAPTEELIMNVTASRWEHHNWAISGFEKILEGRKLSFNIYTEKFFKEKIVEKFSRSYPGWADDIRKLMNELIENGWNLSIPLTAKNYHGSFECYIDTNDITLQKIIESNYDLINLKCSRCGLSGDEYISDGVCEKCR